jgi:hypothetical protein
MDRLARRLTTGPCWLMALPDRRLMMGPCWRMALPDRRLTMERCWRMALLDRRLTTVHSSANSFRKPGLQLEST